MDISRRGFIKRASGTVALGLAGGSVLPLAAVAEETAKLTSIRPEEQRRGDMILRRLGRTGEWVSVIGLGGYHIGKQADENESIRLIRNAIDKGVSFMDNCWDYNGGGKRRPQEKGVTRRGWGRRHFKKNNKYRHQ